MSNPLQKHPSEARRYSFDFLNSQGGTPRSTTFATPLLATGGTEVFIPPLLLPLWTGLLSSNIIPVITVTRDDGQASDLVVGTSVVVSQYTVSVPLSGGTHGRNYTVSVAVPTNAGNTLVNQGVLVVSSNLN
jgi:hypothetical protein